MQETNLTDKEQVILEAATRAFLRYGVKKTTMGDIAKEAGISRQTLYTSFDNKEDVLTAVLKAVCSHKIAMVSKAWQTLNGVEEKLDAYFEIAVIPFFDQLRTMPNYEDFYTGVNEAGKLELERGNEAKKVLLKSLFQSIEPHLQNYDLTADDLADLIVISGENFIQNARDKSHLRSLIKSLQCSTLSILGLLD